MYRSVAVVCLLLPAQVEPAPALPVLSPSVGGIKAEIRDHNGAAVSGVRVLLKAATGRMWVTASNEKGQFKAGNLPPGEYTLELRKDTWQSPLYRQVRIKADAWLLGVPPGPPELRSAGGQRLHVVGPPTYEFTARVITPFTRPEAEKIPTH
jgi:hypothetical protein